ncbi:MAG: GNAT family N-acetyltransferase [Myxococcales bacterium]|nr:GNAT family N-acetyltransferase [Myxococcales bacterium]
MKVHFIGIAGTGMGALARMLKQAGHEVRGSDVSIYPPMSDQLAAAEIPVFEGFAAQNLEWGPECVVVGNVCRADHPEVVAAQAAGLRLESFPSMLASALLPERDPLVVAGTHGKTTTTSLLSWILRFAGLDPSYLIGGVPQNLPSGAHLGQGRPIVLEGDEYDTAFFDKRSKFLHYRPKRAILTSVEFDHADIFAGMDEVRAAFSAFVETIGPDGDLVVNADSPEAMGIAALCKGRVLRYRVLPEDGDLGSAEYCGIVRSKPGSRRTEFELFEHGKSLGRLSTQLMGAYNVGNVLAASAVARAEGVSPDALREAVRRFRGVKRRQELLGLAQGVRVIFDFAHHPTAVQLTVRALRRRYPNKALHVCFEPRSSSSHRRAFSEGYVGSFDAASRVYVAPLFKPQKVDEAERLDTDALARAITARGVPAIAYGDIESLAEAVIASAGPGDTVVLLSSGSFGGLGDRLLNGFGDPVTLGTPDDLPRVNALLEGYELPAVIAGDTVDTLVVRKPDGGIAATVSLQTVGDQSFLFGLAVEPDRRGQGLGWVVGDAVLRLARILGIRTIYLSTTMAADFFASRLGFRSVAIGDVDPAVREAANFQAGAALDNAVCMRLDVDAGG